MIRTGTRTLAHTAAVFAALAVILALAGLGNPGTASAAAFEPGQVVVTPDESAFDISRPEFPLGPREVPLKEVLEQAAQLNSLDLATYPKAVIAGKSFTRAQIESVSGAPKIVFAGDRSTIIRFPGGGQQTFGPDESSTLHKLTPNITIPRKAVNFKVTVSPASRTVKSGTSVQFRATVSGTEGKLSYRWSFGDGKPDDTTSGSTVSRTFTGSDREFRVTLTVTEEGNTRRGAGSAVIRIGKAKKERKKPKKEKPDGNKAGNPGNNSGDYGSQGNSDDYGYGGYGDPYGRDPYSGNYGDTGDPAPAAPSAPKPKKKKPPVPVDDGLVPVRGELLDPDIPAQVIDPSAEQPPGSNPDQQQAAEPKGFALSGGAKTAIGIAVLLGIGGLTEFRSFGRFR